MVGVTAAVGASFCTGFAGVYFEKIVKGSEEVSIWMRNVQLSVASIPLAMLTVLTDWSTISQQGFFYAYDIFVWYVVILNAVGGLLVAMVIKYADNILKNFATSLSIVLSMFFSTLLFGAKINFECVLGTALVIVSIFIYNGVFEFRSVKKVSRSCRIYSSTATV